MFIESQSRKLVFGVGINDAGYMVRVSGVMCPYYNRWTGMLERCYSHKYKERQPTYKDCTVCDEWLTFSNFKSWMEKQDWEGKELDKDIAISGNKVYSPDSCMFVSAEINRLLNKNKARKGEYPTGVSFHKGDQRFHALCMENGKKVFLGSFDDENDAEAEYKKYKASVLLQVSNQQVEPLRSHLARISKEFTYE